MDRPLQPLVAMSRGAARPPAPEGFWSANAPGALLTGLWALPVAVGLLLAAYGIFLPFCHYDPLAVAAFFGDSSSAIAAAPVIAVILVLSVGLVCGGWLAVRQDIRRVPMVAASACVALALTLSVPVLMLKPPAPPSLVSARLVGTQPDARGRFQQVTARLQMDVPTAGRYLIEPALNGVKGALLRTRLPAGTQILDVSFTPAQARAAASSGSGDCLLQVRLSQMVEGEGYRPVQRAEWPMAARALQPILRSLAPQG